MKICVLSDNTGQDGLKGEWGLSFFIEYGDRRYLLDTGASGLFLANARKLGIDLSRVDCAVISHAHYDHSCGLEAFFSCNGAAPVWISPNAGENCYGKRWIFHKYIGLPKGVLAAYEGRFVRPDGVTAIADGVWLVPHTTPGLNRLGRRNHLYVRRGCRFVPDDFSHEQTLVFRTADGLVLLNSCSHSGPDVVVREVQEAFPGERIAAYIGGLHLFRLSDSEVQAVSERMQACGIRRIYTGHCTGQRAYEILKQCLPGTVEQLYCGKVMEL